MDALASHGGAARERIDGLGFTHVVYSKRLAPDAARIHVYFEGDGLPWLHRDTVSTDPTPRQPLALEMMLADTTPAIYVARPCYQEEGYQGEGYQSAATTPPCTPALWTFERYAERVIASMQAVVARLLDRFPDATATLIGYSGGGVLAMFVAEREPRIDTVVTVAANLDTDAWATRHGYSPLVGSLNPARVGTWRSSLRQIHYAGARDSNVPPAIAQAFVARVPHAEVRVIAEYDHRCCWLKDWRQIAEHTDAPVDPSLKAVW